MNEFLKFREQAHGKSKVFVTELVILNFHDGRPPYNKLPPQQEYSGQPQTNKTIRQMRVHGHPNKTAG
jgi:hypothetical protein